MSYLFRLDIMWVYRLEHIFWICFCLGMVVGSLFHGFMTLLKYYSIQKVSLWHIHLKFLSNITRCLRVLHSWGVNERLVVPKAFWFNYKVSPAVSPQIMKSSAPISIIFM